MDLLYTFFTLFGCGAVWLLPTALAAAALVDMLRVRAEWYWCFIIFGIPFFGPLAYFAVNYLPVFGGSQAASTLSPTAYRRTQAKRRLKELQIQLQHWRGPAVLAEAGTQLLGLGKLKPAEELLREAKEADADVKDVNFSLAQVLQVRGQRWQEALPLLEELVELEPDARFGAARLALARCLDESGDAERAEAELRAVLKKRSPPEAKVRLARLLLARGEGREASELLAEVRDDAAAMPKYLVKEHKPWIRKAGRLKSKDTKLPPPKLEGVPPKRSPAFVAAVVLGGLLLVTALVSMFRLYVLPFTDMMQGMGEQSEVFATLDATQKRLDALDERAAADLDTSDAAAVESLLPAFLAVRREAAGCEAVLEAQEEQTRAMDAIREGASFADSRRLGQAMSKIYEAQADYGQALVTSLETHGLAPSTFDRLIALVDGGFLARAEARIFLLPAHFRSDYVIARATLDEEVPRGVDAAWRRDVKTRQAEARAKLEDLDELATFEVPEATRQVLEAQRTALEDSLPARCLPAVLQTLERDIGWMDLAEPEPPLIEH